MKTIICGSGDVGFSIADKLSKEKFEVTVVDEPSEKLNKISDNLDVKVVKGLPSLPSVLMNAGAKECEILIAGNVDAVILAHPAEREYFDNCESAEALIPGIEDEIKLINHYGKKVIGIAINASQSFDTSPLKEKLGMPVLNPIYEDINPLVEKISSGLITG